MADKLKAQNSFTATSRSTNSRRTKQLLQQKDQLAWIIRCFRYLQKFANPISKEEKSLIRGEHSEPSIGTKKEKRRRQYDSNCVLALPTFVKRGLNMPRPESLNAHSFITRRNETKISNGSKPSITSKRGRPRKYRLPISAATSTDPVETLPPVKLHMSTGPGNGGNVGGGDPNENLTPNIAVRSSGSKMNNVAHSLEVKTGEDICSKVYSFCKQQRMCVLSAKGSVSQALLSQAGGSVNYEGRFDIVLLSGVLSENDGLSVLLAGQGCKVFGGRLAGPMIAASPVQVVLGSFTEQTS